MPAHAPGVFLLLFCLCINRCQSILNIYRVRQVEDAVQMWSGSTAVVSRGFCCLCGIGGQLRSASSYSPPLIPTGIAQSTACTLAMQHKCLPVSFLCLGRGCALTQPSKLWSLLASLVTTCEGDFRIQMLSIPSLMLPQQPTPPCS